MNTPDESQLVVLPELEPNLDLLDALTSDVEVYDPPTVLPSDEVASDALGVLPSKDVMVDFVPAELIESDGVIDFESNGWFSDPDSLGTLETDELDDMLLSSFDFNFDSLGDTEGRGLNFFVPGDRVDALLDVPEGDLHFDDFASGDLDLAYLEVEVDAVLDELAGISDTLLDSVSDEATLFTPKMTGWPTSSSLSSWFSSPLDTGRSVVFANFSMRGVIVIGCPGATTPFSQPSSYSISMSRFNSV